MQTKDINIFESGSGGELSILNNDISLGETLYQTIYLALFGGNIEASTRGNELPGEERFDYWGNSLIFSNRQSKQFNSETERVLDEVTINSSGRVTIQNAVENDLSFLNDVVNLEVNIVLLSLDKIKIEILASSISNQSEKSLQFVWDNAKKAIILDRKI